MLRPSRRQIHRWQRERKIQRWIWYGLGVLAGLIVLILGFGYVRENYLRAGEVAATVYGQPITVDQVAERARSRLQIIDTQARLYQAQGGAQAAAQFSLQRARVPDQVLDSLIEERLVEQELSRRSIMVSKDAVLEKLRQEVADEEASRQPAPTPTPVTPGAAPTPTPGAEPTPFPTPTVVPTLTSEAFDAAYQAFLTGAGFTDEQYQGVVRGRLMRERLTQAMRADLPTSEEQVHARHILLDTAEKAALAQAQLKAGVPFDQVAREMSADPGSKDKGGDLGWFARGVMVPAFEQAAFSQELGVIGEPFPSTHGTHIVQVLEKDLGRPLAEDQVETRASQAYQTWYAGLKGSSDVDNQLTAERRAWILRRAGGARSPG